MRSFTVHPASLALGLVLAGAIFLSMSQSIVATPLRVEYVPHPRDMVQIKEGTPYTVPAGRVLAITAMGRSEIGCGSPTQILKVNGVVEITNYFGATGIYVQSVPSGFTVPAGAVVEVADVQSFSCGRAWGYLVNQ